MRSFVVAGSHPIWCFITPLLLTSTLAQAAREAVHKPQYVQEPTIVEFDGIFPVIEETYAPASAFPLVLAVQNATAALALRPQVYWYIRTVPEDMHHEDPATLEYLFKQPAIESGVMTELGWSLPDGAPSNFSTDNLKDGVYYYTAWTGMLNDTVPEGVYSVTWLINYVNCTDLVDPDWQSNPSSASLVVHHTFYVEKGNKGTAKKPDLSELAASSPDCPYYSTAVQVLGEAWMEEGHDGHDYHICAQLAGWGTFSLPRDSSCQAKLGLEAAASISAGAPTGFELAATATTTATATTPAVTVASGSAGSAAIAEEPKKESRACRAGPGSSSSLLGSWVAVGVGLITLFMVV